MRNLEEESLQHGTKNMIPQFDRMITNPNGAVIREKESEYQKNLDNLTEEIPVVNLKEKK